LPTLQKETSEIEIKISPISKNASLIFYYLGAYAS